MSFSVFYKLSGMKDFVEWLRSTEMPGNLAAVLEAGYDVIAGNTETAIAKNPQEYGLPYIRERFNLFRDRFFDGDAGTIPAELPIGFSNTIRALGHCACKYRSAWSPNAENVWEKGVTIVSCSIQLSNAYDFTPKKLDEVLIHEMIHAYLSYAGYPQETHGPRFQEWCNRINGQSDYHITVTNDTPVTLNQGMANRVVNDGTVLVTVRDFEPEKTLVCRVPDKELGWSVPRIERWKGMKPVIYACSDANFKKRFKTVRTRIGGSLIPNVTMDEMVDAGILKEIPVAEQKPQDAYVLASPWYGKVSMVLADKDSVPQVSLVMHGQQKAHGEEDRVSMYAIKKHVDAWARPVVKGSPRSFSVVILPRDEFNLMVTDGTLDYMDDI